MRALATYEIRTAAGELLVLSDEEFERIVQAMREERSGGR